VFAEQHFHVGGAGHVAGRARRRDDGEAAGPQASLERVGEHAAAAGDDDSVERVHA
jgi:hypothetical protein